MYQIFDVFNGVFLMRRIGTIPGPIKAERATFDKFQDAYNWAIDSREHAAGSRLEIYKSMLVVDGAFE
jgi:hypothetical protein